MATPAFRPTHVVPPDGLPAWESPDVARPTEPLDALLPVELRDRRGDWAYVACSNGWSAWVDGRLLVSVPQAPPAPGRPLARTADPRPLLARAEESLTRYRRAAQDLAEGRSDGEGFRQRTRGLRVGMVVDGESVWLYDAEHERWVHCDGTRLSTYAAQAGPGAAAPESGEAEAPAPAPSPSPSPSPAAEPPRREAGEKPDPEPTRVVAPDGPEPTRVVTTDEPEPTRVVTTDEPEPTRVVTTDEPDPTRVVTPDEAEPTRAITVTGPDEPPRGGTSGDAGR
ncbi:hypothetical protein [Streptomyces anulatus]|uniref:Uncharacterized protein n=1 Tax=Streptomyces anulatus TaxID=1892 RepID=A0A7K3R346_STRAQ|nr:hypothetical protein [Streptomyces anulatus]NEB96436.1 hypothetical protein [Streptomyces anulatus]NED23822.1 hypothetical protein [Streptomyces anulatus]